MTDVNAEKDTRIENALEYAKSLINIPYRWYDESVDLSNPDDQFWCNNGDSPNIKAIILEDKSIVCTGLINLMRRYVGLPIPKHDTCPWWNCRMG